MLLSPLILPIYICVPICFPFFTRFSCLSDFSIQISIYEIVSIAADVYFNTILLVAHFLGSLADPSVRSVRHQRRLTYPKPPGRPRLSRCLVRHNSRTMSGCVQLTDSFPMFTRFIAGSCGPCELKKLNNVIFLCIRVNRPQKLGNLFRGQ